MSLGVKGLNEFLNEPAINLWDDSVRATQLVTESQNRFIECHKQFHHQPIHIAWAEKKTYRDEEEGNEH
jgi:hypothetical protein